ncbi:MAG: PQQ-binding-like beta-propeller repeat protein [Opitutae bacterium]
MTPRRISLFFGLALATGLQAIEFPPLPEDGSFPHVTSEEMMPAALDRFLVKAGVPRGHPGYPFFHNYLDFYFKFDAERGVAGIYLKYFDYLLENVANMNALVAHLEDQPQKYQDRWIAWLSERMVGYRIPYDMEAMHRLFQSIPRGEVRSDVTAEDLRKWFAGQYGALGAKQQAEVANALARINPDIFPSGQYRGDSGQDPRWVISDGDWNHAYSISEGAVVLLPDPNWLRTLAKGIALDVVQEELIQPKVMYRHYNLSGAGIGGTGMVLRLELVEKDGELQVIGGTATVPTVHNLSYPVIPLAFQTDALTKRKFATSFKEPWLFIDENRIYGSCRINYGRDRDIVSVELQLDLPLEAGDGSYITRSTDDRGRSTVSKPSTARFIEEPKSGTAPKGSWPMFAGKNSSSISKGETMVELPEDAALGWVSDLPIPMGRGPDTRGKAKAIEPGMPIMGGHASPVVADGIVYLPYYKPSGNKYAYDAASMIGVAKQDDPLEVTPKQAQLNSLERNRWEMNKIVADEYLHAFDAATGKTLWQLRLPGRGINWAGFNKGGTSVTTPAIGGNTVVWIGTSGEVYAAANGKLKWVHHIGLRHEFMLQERRLCLAESRLFATRSDFLTSPVVVGSVVVVPTFIRIKTGYRYETKNGLKGMDLETGRILWHQPECSEAAGPQIWDMDGRQLLLSANRDETFLIDPKDGSILASQKGLTNASFGFFTTGGNIVVGDEEETKRFTAYRYTSSKGFERIWQLDSKYELREGGGVYIDGHFYLQDPRGAHALICVEAETGQVVSEVIAPLNGGEHAPFLVSDGKRLIASKDRTAALLFFDADPAKLPTSTRYWSLSMTTGYCSSVVPALVDGRMFIRSPDRLLAYDLRASHQPERPQADLWDQKRNLHVYLQAEADKKAQEVTKREQDNEVRGKATQVAKKETKAKELPTRKIEEPDPLDTLLDGNPKAGSRSIDDLFDE